MGIKDLLVRISGTLSARVGKAAAVLATLPVREDLEEGEIDEELSKCEGMVKMVEWLHVCLGLAALRVSGELNEAPQSI